MRKGLGPRAPPAHRALQPRPHPRGAWRRAPRRRRCTARSWPPIPTRAARGSTSRRSGARRGDREGYLAELREGVEKAPDFGACYWYLAREELGAGRLDAAADLARRGLEAQPVSEVAPLGHYVLADVYNRQGQGAKAKEEVGKAQRLEAALRKNPAL